MPQSKLEDSHARPLGITWDSQVWTNKQNDKQRTRRDTAMGMRPPSGARWDLGSSLFWRNNFGVESGAHSPLEFSLPNHFRPFCFMCGLTVPGLPEHGPV